MANFNKAKKLHFIYKTTNLINGRYYIGMHSTNNLNDGYMGSGKQLRAAIRKYGEENFRVEILEYLPDRSSLALREKEIVNEDLLKDPQCMNLKEGGNGGLCNEAHKLKFLESGISTRLNNPAAPAHKKLKELYSNQLWKRKKNKNVKAGLKRVNHNHATFKGKHHNEASKIKISNSKKGKNVGEDNSQFGTKWITNGQQNKKIKKTETIPTGWEFGRS